MEEQSKETKIETPPDAGMQSGGAAKRRQTSYESNRLRQHSAQRIRHSFLEPKDQDMMGPLMRRKKVVSVPLGAKSDDFFCAASPRAPFDPIISGVATDPNVTREMGYPTGVAKPPRQRYSLTIGNVIKRKQMSLDLYAPEQADFFGAPLADQPDISETIPLAPGEGTEPATDADEIGTPEDAEEKPKKLFFPLQFSPPVNMQGRQGGHGVPPPSFQPVTEGPVVDDAVRDVVEQQVRHNRELSVQIAMLTDRLEGEMDGEQEKLLDDINATRGFMESETRVLQDKLFGEETFPEERLASPDDEITEKEEEVEDDEGIIRAGRSDYIWTGVLLCIMITFTGFVVGWDTHLDESYSTFGPVGLACATPCTGDLESQDYFNGHSRFETGQFIQLDMQLDPSPYEVEAAVEIVGHETGQVKAKLTFGPPFSDVPANYKEKIEVDFDDPHEEHIINVTSTDPDVVLTFKLHASTLSPMAKYSELIAALIMVFVYIFILLEVIHRTLVAIFGSMVALLFFFIIHEGDTESIETIMLHMEWSTLSLLFGMMLIVGELSHTGIFEWLAVRLLAASKGSYNRLMVLLCLLTAVASAFLDNVTTMLLVAPVTIDMCSILNVDPRPYLIGEVILSNVGGTATLIGDPPNIIIGSAFEEIGFVDFIINVMPCIFLLCIPVSVCLVLYMYRYYTSSTKMPELDRPKLTRTYRIYDEPRLMIAGTVAFFVILIFFLHPVHHKDTAWIALFGAFITMTFTNPHDVQDALRNHVEWDTLLFFAGLFVLVEVCAALGLLAAIGEALASYIAAQDEEKQLAVAITLILWVSAITSAFLDNIPYTATMIPVIRILADQLPDTLPIETLAWALSFGACLGGNGTLLGASANIVTAGISTSKGFEISFVNFMYPGMVTMFFTVAIANLYMLVIYVWV